MQSVFYGHLIDGTGAPMIENGMVVVEDGRIRYAGRKQESYPLDPHAAVYDYSGNYLLPGLIESHSHLAGYRSGNTLDWVIDPYAVKICQCVHDLEALTNAGYTSVRDLGGYGCLLRRAMARGTIRGPRIFACGAAISPTSGHADVWTDFPAEILADWEQSHAVADGADQCRYMARKQFRGGADFIKIMTTGGIMDSASDPNKSYFTHDEIRAIVDEAEAMGTYVSTHAESNGGILKALKAGVKVIEHGYSMSDETIELMLKNGCYQVPTLGAMRVLYEGLGTMTPITQEKIRAVVPQVYASCEKQFRAGIPMASGADFLSIPGCGEYGTNAMDIIELTKIGMSNMDAIVAATKRGAELMLCADELGTLESGKLADLIVVEKNPLDRIETLLDTNGIKLVMKEGVVQKHIS